MVVKWGKIHLKNVSLRTEIDGPLNAYFFSIILHESDMAGPLAIATFTNFQIRLPCKRDLTLELEMNNELGPEQWAKLQRELPREAALVLEHHVQLECGNWLNAGPPDCQAGLFIPWKQNARLPGKHHRTFFHLSPTRIKRSRVRCRSRQAVRNAHCRDGRERSFSHHEAGLGEIRLARYKGWSSTVPSGEKQRFGIRLAKGIRRLWPLQNVAAQATLHAQRT